MPCPIARCCQNTFPPCQPPQGYTNAVLALLDAGDAALLFRPYYFNHLMALQMTGSARELVLPDSTPELQPDVNALAAEMEARAAAGRPPLRLVTLVNPGNPTGVMVPKQTLEQVAALCAVHGSWLLVDNTYEHFEYEGAPPHACVEGPHVLNLFSFSKAFGMMGWRVGYLAFPPSLKPELFKVQVLSPFLSEPPPHSPPYPSAPPLPTYSAFHTIPFLSPKLFRIHALPPPPRYSALSSGSHSLNTSRSPPSPSPFGPPAGHCGHLPCGGVAARGPGCGRGGARMGGVPRGGAG